MKGHFYTGPLAYVIDVKGESWFQGQKVEGELAVKNQEKGPLSLNNIGVALAIGEFKKVHAHDANAFKRLGEVTFATGDMIQPGEEKRLPFQFDLDPNCWVTDKKGSLFLLYGQDLQSSHLQLLVSPRPIFKQIAECLERFFRFKLKDVKSDKKGVVYKFKAPSSREFSHVDLLDCNLFLDGKDLLMNLTFNIKKLDATSVITKLAKAKTEFSYRLMEREHSLSKDAIHQEKILSVLSEAVEQMKLKIFK